MMLGCRWTVAIAHAEPLLRDARAERDAGRGDDGAVVRMLFDVPIHLGSSPAEWPAAR